MELDNNNRYDHPDEDYRTDGSQDSPPLTLADVKDALSTYGANPEERNAPAFVVVNGVRIPLSGAEVDWTWGEGHVVLLHAEEQDYDAVASLFDSASAERDRRD